MANYPGLLGLDATFELDHFQRPRLRDENELIKNTLLFILFMVPGQYPSIPSLGLNLREQLYSYYDELDPETLKKDIVNNCTALQLSFDIGKINVRKMLYRGRPSLIIYISTDSNDGWAEDFISSERKRTQREYYIGITLNELNEIIYNINEKGV